MPSIPYESQIDARTGRSSGQRISNAFDANYFGQQQGEGLQRAGQQVEQTGDLLEAEANRKAKEIAIYEQSTFDFTDEENKVKQTVGEDAEGYKEAIRTAFINKVSEKTNVIQDDRARKMAKEALLADLPKYTEQASRYQQKTMEDTTKLRTNEALTANTNKVLADPTYYDTAIKLNSEMIDTYGHRLSAATRAEMKSSMEFDVTKKRFDSMMTKAKTPEDLDAIQAEMSSDQWRGKLLPRDYEDAFNKIDSAKKVYANKVDSEVKAGLKDLEERAKDIKAIIPQEELADMSRKVMASGDAQSISRFARVQRDQAILRSDGKLTASQLKQRMEDLKQKPTTGVSPVALQEVGDVSTKYGVSASYLAQGLSRETDGTNPAVKNPESSAMGAGQFIKDTWLRLTKDPAVAQALGITPGMSEAAVLALRGDRKASIEAMAILAKQNKAIMEPQVGHPLDDAELYLGHFLGATSAVKFINASVTNPEAAAAEMFPDAAASNRNVFYSKDGKPYSVAQVYSNISRSFDNTVSHVAYDDMQTYQRMYDEQVKALPTAAGMEYAVSAGIVPAVDLQQEGAYALLGKTNQIASTYYKTSIPPFNNEQEANIQRILSTGTSADALGVLTNIQTMGPTAAKAAFAQLKLKAPAFATAGQLALSGDPSTAQEIVRGSIRMRDNPAMATGLGYEKDKAAIDFESAVGPALSQVDFTERQAMQEASLALLAETKGASGSKYTSSDYKEAVRKALGGRIEKVNGFQTYLPQGVTARELTGALQRMTLADYTALSVDGSTPKYADGTPVNPLDLADDIQLRARGGDTYFVLDSDGSAIGTGQADKYGTIKPFIIQLDAARVKNIAQRAITREQQASATDSARGQAGAMALATGAM